MSFLSTDTMDKTLRNNTISFWNPFHYYTLLFVSVELRSKIYEYKRKGSNTAPVQKRVKYEIRESNSSGGKVTGLPSNEIR